MVENRQKFLEQHDQNTNQETGKQSPRGEKRTEPPATANDSDDERTNKKRKTNDDDDLKEVSKMNLFSPGKGNDKNNDSKKKVGRRSIKKAKRVARNTGIEGLRDNIKGVSEEYKSTTSMEHIKEIGEIIGVSWTKAEEKKFNEIASGDKKGVGIGEAGKKGRVNSIIREERPDVNGLHETKCDVVDEAWVEELWGSRGFGFTQLSANGNSGGIILIWDSSSFTFKGVLGDERFVAVKGEWKGRGGDIFLVCIYGPHVDLNVVRRSDDRLNSQVCFREMEKFNDFINDAKLIEVPMSDCKLSDHCPIVLKDIDLDFGPNPFRTFGIWLEEGDIGTIVETSWNLKERIEACKKEAMRWELESENRILDANERVAWLEARKQLLSKENEFGNMLRQKARVKWGVEGDEDSKFYHSFIKRRNNKSNIRGLMVNGVWCEDPRMIKAELVRHYKLLFSKANTPYYSRPIRRIQDFDESKDHCLTLKNTPYPHQRYAVYNTLVNDEELIGFTSIRCIHQEDTAYPCLHFTRNHEDIKPNTPYPGTSICRIQDLLYTKILEDIKRGPYSKKSPIRRIPHSLIRRIDAIPDPIYRRPKTQF
ncbi:transposon TX1 [Tanacetum coccineum]